MTRDPHGGTRRLSALVDDVELSPELALVDPDIAERARYALPDITLTETRLGLRRSLETGQTPTPSVPYAFESAAATASAGDMHRVLHEARPRPRRRRRSMLAALVILGAAGVALAATRALDGSGTPTSASRPSSGASAATLVPPTNLAKGTGTSKAKAKARKTATPRARPPRKARRRRKKQAVAPPASSRRPSKPEPKPRPVRPRARALPDFVWAPVKNARGYLVEFRADSKVVLRVRTRGARLHVSGEQLRRGRYRWLVWRVSKSGSRIGEPLVDSAVRLR